VRGGRPNMNKHLGLLCLAALVALSPSPLVHADAVTDWNAAFESTLPNPAERGPRVPSRTWAILHVAMFDAVNGIERRYTPCHVTDLAPPGARAEAAAIQAAYAALSTLRPAYQNVWDAQLQTSLAALAGEPGKSESIARGRAWGEQVAHAIIAWRANDGSNTVLPPFVGSTAAGYWRHAPLQNSPTANYAALVTLPFLLPNQPAVDPGPPYGHANRALALLDPLYATDVNESKARGGLTSLVRTAPELEHALFNNACDLASFNRLLRSVLPAHDRLGENARRFALLNIAYFDTQVMLFRAKYVYAFWRPFQAIRYADEGQNPAIVQDPNWTSYLPTPPHPEYPSAHVTLFAAMGAVITRFFGDVSPIEFTAPGYTPRTYPSVAAIIDATAEGRINLGYHLRDTNEASKVMGNTIGERVARDGLAPVHH
jgi:hypothetical protein